jgi:sulfite exporter TauE/SafE/copper chaperone CopZ
MNESITFHAHGMHCHGCERVIEAGLRKQAGVARAVADYPTETVVVEYDPEIIDAAALRACVEIHGYRVSAAPRAPAAPWRRVGALASAIVILAALILIDARWIADAGAPDISRHMSLWLIFALGLVTGFHCIGMCGGFVVSYATAASLASERTAPAHLAYAAGKTLSYAAFGALFGALGAFVAFTPALRGAAGIAAGLFLIVFGLNMLGLFRPLRRFRLGLPAPLENWIHREAHAPHRPFVIGLLNGLMIACGPLQAMYVMAAGTGSALEGAKMLLAFGLGTLPVMLAFGAVASLLSRAATHRLLRASGLIVVALGAVMINRGLILTGAGLDLASLVDRATRVAAPPAPVIEAAQGAQTIRMTADAGGYAPAHFVLTRGVPVDWVIDAKEITHCNKRIVVPALKLEFDLAPGLQTIRFTPQTAGLLPWSCWMGMIRGDFDVVEPGAPVAAPPADAPTAPEAAPEKCVAAPAPAVSAPPDADVAPRVQTQKGQHRPRAKTRRPHR